MDKFNLTQFKQLFEEIDHVDSQLTDYRTNRLTGSNWSSSTSLSSLSSFNNYTPTMDSVSLPTTVTATTSLPMVGLEITTQNILINSIFNLVHQSTLGNSEMTMLNNPIFGVNGSLVFNSTTPSNLPMPINETSLNNELGLGPVRDPLWTTIPMTILYVLILVTGVVGNLVTCAVIAHNRYMHTATNYYLFSLAISDLLLLLLGLPQEIQQIWRRYPYAFGEAFCVLRGFTAEASTNSSVLTITAFTIERYVAICHPLRSHTMSKLSRAVKLIVVIWLLGFFCAAPIAYQLGIVFDYIHDQDKIPQSANCNIKRHVPLLDVHIFTLQSLLVFVLPVTLISVLYILIGIKLRQSSRQGSQCGELYKSSIRSDSTTTSAGNQPIKPIKSKSNRRRCTIRRLQSLSNSNSINNESDSVASIDVIDLDTTKTNTDHNARVQCLPNNITDSFDSDQQSPFHRPIKSPSNCTIGQIQPQHQSKPMLALSNKKMSTTSLPQQPPSSMTSVKLVPLSSSKGTTNSVSHIPATVTTTAATAATATTTVSGRRRIRLNKFTSSSSSAASSSGSGFNSSLAQRRAVIKMLTAVVVAFFVCFAPFHAQRLMAIYVKNPSNYEKFAFQLLTYISGVTYYLSATINPILYSIMSVRFRQAFHDTFVRTFCPSKSAIFNYRARSMSQMYSNVSHHHNHNHHQNHNPNHNQNYPNYQNLNQKLNFSANNNNNNVNNNHYHYHPHHQNTNNFNFNQSYYQQPQPQPQQPQSHYSPPPPATAPSMQHKKAQTLANYPNGINSIRKNPTTSNNNCSQTDSGIQFNCNSMIIPLRCSPTPPSLPKQLAPLSPMKPTDSVFNNPNDDECQIVESQFDSKLVPLLICSKTMRVSTTVSAPAVSSVQSPSPLTAAALAQQQHQSESLSNTESVLVPMMIIQPVK